MNKDIMIKIGAVILVIILLVVFTVLMKNKGKESNGNIPDTNIGETQDNNSNKDGDNQDEQDNKSNKDVDISTFKYDLISLVDINRTPDEYEKYQAYGLNTEVEYVETNEDINTNTDKPTGTDGTTDTTGTTDDPQSDSKKVEVIRYNHETVDKFLNDTQIKEEEIEDLYIAYYPDLEYIVGIVDAKDEENILNKIENYKQDYIRKHPNNENAAYIFIETYNNCVVFALGENSTSIGDGIINGLTSITESLINS